MENSYLRFLSKGSIFTLIPRALEDLEPFMEIEIATPGKVIFNKGDILGSLVIPLQEPLSLISDERVLFLQKGRTLALSSLLRNTPLPYKVISEDFNKVLVLPRHFLMNYFEQHPGILTYLLLMTECESFRRIKHMLTEKDVDHEDLIKISSVISDPIPFDSSLLSKGFILVENGKFSIGGNDFSGEYKSGEFLGGFHAVNRPNPGYEVTGQGQVRFIDKEKFRSLSLSKATLEYFTSDPWIIINNKKDSRNTSQTEIPSAVLEKWITEDLSLDPKDLKTCDSDWDSIKETIYMLLNIYKIDVNRSVIDNRLARASVTICFSVIAEILEHHGLLTKIIKWKEDIDQLKLPMVLPFGNRIVLVLGRDEKKYHCFDGCKGFYKIDKGFFYKNCPDFSINISSVKSLDVDAVGDVKKNRMKTLRLILSVITTERKAALRIGLITLCTYALGAISPTLNQTLIDEVLKTEDRSTLFMCLSGLALVGFFTVVFDFMKNKLITKSSMTLDDILTRYIYNQAQKLGPNSFAKLGTGGILSRMMEMEKIRSFFSAESLNVVFSLGSAIIYGSMLAGYGSELILFISGYFLVILVLQFFGRKYLYKINLLKFNLQSKTNSFIGDCIGNVLAIKAFSASASVSKDWESMNTDLAIYGKKSALYSGALSQVVDVLGQTANIGIIWFCIVSMNKPDSSLSFGQLFAIIQLINQTLSPMGNLVNFLTTIEDMKLSVDKVNDILFAEDSEGSKAKHSVNISGKIKFDRVSFKYSADSPLILKDISLTIYPGQSVAIVGKSGSGKTTIANLIAKENLPSVGRIYFDDVDSSFIDSSEIKSQIGYIQQNNRLFSGSIKSNVAFKEEAPDVERLEISYRMSNSDSFISGFPQRDEQYLAEGGLGLSGGQKQRLTMARTIYSNPKIMILDEATSALDSESEGVIISKLLENKGKVTSIVIAHRLSTIRNADFVYVVDRGEIVQEGTHNDLILKDGVYKELFQDQAS